MHPNDLYFEIASLRGQDLRDQAAHERMLHQAAEGNHERSHCALDVAYLWLAVAILRLSSTR